MLVCFFSQRMCRAIQCEACTSADPVILAYPASPSWKAARTLSVAVSAANRLLHVGSVYMLHGISGCHRSNTESPQLQYIWDSVL